MPKRVVPGYAWVATDCYVPIPNGIIKDKLATNLRHSVPVCPIVQGFDPARERPSRMANVTKSGAFFLRLGEALHLAHRFAAFWWPRSQIANRREVPSSRDSR